MEKFANNELLECSQFTGTWAGLRQLSSPARFSRRVTGCRLSSWAKSPCEEFCPQRPTTLPSPGNLGFQRRASTSPSAWGTQALLGCLRLTIASFNHPFLCWKKKKSQFQTKIYWSITMTANIRSSSPNKKSSRNIPRDKIPSSALFSATLEVHFKLSTLRMFWHRLRKKMRIFPISFFF